jgi:hypothetical protein
MAVFLSSSYKDLIEYRAAAIRTVEGTSYQAVKVEVFGARSEEPLDAIQPWQLDYSRPPFSGGMVELED